jgi:hypothetical protein
MIQYRLDHIMSYTAKLTGPEMIGAVPDWIRANIYVTGGEVTGPKLRWEDSTGWWRLAHRT